MDFLKKVERSFEVVVEQPEDCGDDKFVIDDMGKAEWAAKKIAQRQARIKVIQDYAAEKIAKIEQWAKDEIEPLQSDVNFFSELLRPYVTAEVAKLKKGKSFKLPNGVKLGLKANLPTYDYNDEELLGFLADNGYEEYIKAETKMKPVWGEFKKLCSVKEIEQTDEAGNTYKELVLVVNDTGEIVNKVKVIPAEPDKLSIDVKGIEL